MRLRHLGLLALLLTSASGTSLAQDEPAEPPAKPFAIDLENTRWSMVQPDGEFEGGCATGYMSLQLRPNGYFILNNRLSGAWMLDETGKLRLRIKQGPYVVLGIDGDKMQLLQNLPSLRIRKQTVFQRCSE